MRARSLQRVDVQLGDLARAVRRCSAARSRRCRRARRRTGSCGQASVGRRGPACRSLGDYPSGGREAPGSVNAPGGAALRVTGTSITAVSRLIKEVGLGCLVYHDQHVRGIAAARIQCDEIWSYVYAKQKRVASMVEAPPGAGDVWTWTALDPDSKLIVGRALVCPPICGLGYFRRCAVIPVTVGSALRVRNRKNTRCQGRSFTLSAEPTAKRASGWPVGRVFCDAGYIRGVKGWRHPRTRLAERLPGVVQPFEYAHPTTGQTVSLRGPQPRYDPQDRRERVLLHALVRKAHRYRSDGRTGRRRQSATH